MSFFPIHKHVEVQPIEEDSIIAQNNTTFEEKGTVLSFDTKCEYAWNVGDIVYFDAWLIAKYFDSEGKERYLVPEENIRAYESISE